MGEVWEGGRDGGVYLSYKYVAAFLMFSLSGKKEAELQSCGILFSDLFHFHLFLFFFFLVL